MVTFTRFYRNPKHILPVDCATVLQASQAIQRNWTSEERMQRAALAKMQTLKLIELIFGSTYVSNYSQTLGKIPATSSDDSHRG